jgi:hypothetical protein
MTPEKRAELALEQCGVSWPSENSIRVLSVFLRNASRDAYEDAASIREIENLPSPLREQLQAAIRARSTQGDGE